MYGVCTAHDKSKSKYCALYGTTSFLRSYHTTMADIMLIKNRYLKLVKDGDPSLQFCFSLNSLIWSHLVTKASFSYLALTAMLTCLHSAPPSHLSNFNRICEKWATSLSFSVSQCVIVSIFDDLVDNYRHLPLYLLPGSEFRGEMSWVKDNNLHMGMLCLSLDVQLAPVTDT